VGLGKCFCLLWACTRSRSSVSGCSLWHISTEELFLVQEECPSKWLWLSGTAQAVASSSCASSSAAGGRVESGVSRGRSQPEAARWGSQPCTCMQLPCAVGRASAAAAGLLGQPVAHQPGPGWWAGIQSEGQGCGVMCECQPGSPSQECSGWPQGQPGG